MKRTLFGLWVAVGTNAFAQYNPGGEIIGPAIVLGAAESSLVVGSLVTALGSTASIGKTQHGRVPWFVCSYIAGAANLAVGGYALAGNIVQRRNGYGGPIALAMTAGHLSLALWNLLVPTLGLLSSPAPDSGAVAPVLVSGRDRAGKAWAGLGVTLTRW